VPGHSRPNVRAPLGQINPSGPHLYFQAYSQLAPTTTTTLSRNLQATLHRNRSGIPSLPLELLANVDNRLNRAQITALRQTYRQLSHKMDSMFVDSFKSIRMTCTAAELHRLQHLISAPYPIQIILAKIEHVTICTLEAEPTLLEWTDIWSSWNKKVSCLSMPAYEMMRQTLVTGLNALPKLKSVRSRIKTSTADFQLTCTPWGPGHLCLSSRLFLAPLLVALSSIWTSNLLSNRTLRTDSCGDGKSQRNLLHLGC
jgi:hypothetical protein